MSKYQFTPQAEGDLLDLWSFIARDSPDAADRVEAAIFRACDLLADSPFAGNTRKDLTPLPLRFWVVQPYSSYLNCLRPGEEATSSHPYPSRCSRPSPHPDLAVREQCKTSDTIRMFRASRFSLRVLKQPEYVPPLLSPGTPSSDESAPA
jgi:plasmid stabilization system protein ParE